MFCDAAGRARYPGKVVRTFTYDGAIDSAVPSWLVPAGTSPIITYSNPSAGRGAVRIQTKIATPTSGDTAAVQTAWNIATAQFEEISFVAYSLLTDGANATDHTVSLSMNDGARGFYFQNNNATGQTTLRVYPQAPTVWDWPFGTESNQTRRKDVGITIRPRTKEVFVTTGDPYDGAGVIAYDVGNWVDLTGAPMSLQVYTRQAAQHYMEFSRLMLRLVSN